MNSVMICQAGPLEAYARDLVLAMEADADVAGEVARHLVRSNLSGHDSHGVQRLPQYAGRVASGELVPSARPRVAREAPAAALIEAGSGFGHFSTAFALEWAMERAPTTGVAAAAVRHSHHIGRVGEYVERAAERGLVAMVTVGTAGPGVGGMALPGSRRRFLGANPWCFGFPVDRRPPVVFDGSMSTVAEGKVQVARARGARLPAGAIHDAEGRPTTDPEHFYAGGAIVPLGGEVAGHKGYGMALAAAFMGGLGMIADPAPTLIGASSVEPGSDPAGRIGGVFVMVVDPDAFGGRDGYREITTATVEAAKRFPRAPGVEEITLPGEPEVASRERRGADGIPIPAATWEALGELAARWRVTVPAVREGVG